MVLRTVPRRPVGAPGHRAETKCTALTNKRRLPCQAARMKGDRRGRCYYHSKRNVGPAAAFAARKAREDALAATFARALGLAIE